MARNKKVGRRLVLLVVLLGAAALFAAVSVINVTYWYINTTKPPVVKYVGDDARVMNGTFVRADWYYDANTGINVTRIYVTGVPGDIVNITNALRVCNNYNVPVKIRVSDVRLLQDYYPDVYIRYMAVKIIEPPGAADNKVEIKDEAVIDTTTDYVTLAPGQCAILGVDLVIDANAPYHKTLAAYQINIEKVPLGHGFTAPGGGGSGGGSGTGGGTGTGGSGGGGGIRPSCSFASSSGSRFGSPDGSPARGFNELNGWVAAWGPSGGGVRIALMPSIIPPDSTGTGARYMVELDNVQIGTLTVSGGNASVSITGPTPGFMPFMPVVAKIWLEPGGYILYDNGSNLAVTLAPGTYQVRATLFVAPGSDVYGSTADLTLTCNGTPTATITLRVPNPDEWGLRADIYTWTSPTWPPFQGPSYTYRGTWSVGAIYHWIAYAPNAATEYDRLGLRSPYFTSAVRSADNAPKWAAYWIDPGATSWRNWAVKFTGRLYVPWSSVRVGVWHDDGVYVKLCSIDTGNSRWGSLRMPEFYTASGTCTDAPGEYSVEVGYHQGPGGTMLVFLVGPGTGNEAYIPTIDGAWRCANFDWSQGTCRTSWSFVAASPSVPYFVATNYTPGSTDGGGEPRP